MRKSKIEKRALDAAKAGREAAQSGREAAQSGREAARDAREGVQEAPKVGAVDLSRETIEAIVAALRPVLFEAARLAAADTVRTVERPETVMRRALDEAKAAAEIGG